MDADTEVFQRVTEIDGLIGMLSAAAGQASAEESRLQALIETLSQRSAEARQAVLMRSSEQDIFEAVHAVVEAAEEALDTCLEDREIEPSLCGLISQVHTQAEDLKRQLNPGPDPVPAEPSAGPKPL